MAVRLAAAAFAVQAVAVGAVAVLRDAPCPLLAGAAGILAQAVVVAEAAYALAAAEGRLSDEEVIALALTYCQGKAIINSINLEDGEERFEKVVPLAKRG